MIDLNSKENIEKYIRRQANNFNFVDRIASFVNNREFGIGYYRSISSDNDGSSIDFVKDINSGYIWKVLSSAGNDLGEVLYENVADYIDNVSNVGTCKIKSLMSMMNMLGIGYDLPNKISYYPIEIQNLMNIFSINERYLLDNKYIKSEVIDYLYNTNVISSMQISSLSANIGEIEISSLRDNYSIDSDKLDNFISATYRNLITDFLNQTYYYEDVPDNSLIRKNKKLLNDIGYFSDQFVKTSPEQIKRNRINNIVDYFDPEAIAKSIIHGEDSIDNYEGYKYNLISSALEDWSKEYEGRSLSTRYYKAKEDKLIEYANFVDNTYSNLSGTSYEIYKFDKNYIIQNLSNINVIDEESSELNQEMIDYVAGVLLSVTKYIRKLRQTIRLQAKKIYMKGTNDLLIYTINEFLIDYVNHFLFENYSKTDLSNIVNNIRSNLIEHNPNDINVIEYFDETEYFNLKTDTTKYSKNKNVNARFFDDYFRFNNGTGHVERTSNSGLEFTDDEISEFYLNTLRLKNDLAPQLSDHTDDNLQSHFYDFLSVLFDVGANKSYIFDDLYGNEKFGTELINGTITSERHNDYLKSIEISNYFRQEIEKCGYETSSDVDINTQEMSLYDKLDEYYTEYYLSSVSSTFDQYYQRVERVGYDVQKLRDDLETYLSDTYSFYFCQSEYKICYDNGNYKYNYFVGNPAYDTNYFIERLNLLDDYVNNQTENYIVNHPVYDTLDLTKTAYNNIHDEIENKITKYLVENGYNNLDLTDLGEQLEDEKEFIQTRTQNRLNYLQTSLQDFKTQALSLKSSHEQLVNNLNSIIASLPSSSQKYYFVCNFSSTGRFKKYSSIQNEDDEHIVYYDKFSGCFYKTRRDGTYKEGKYDIGTFPTIKEDASLNSRIDTAIQISEIQYYQGDSGQSYETTSTDSLKALKASYIKLIQTFESIVSQVRSLYNLDKSKVDELKKYISGGESYGEELDVKVNALIEFLSTKITENEFNLDTVISQFHTYMNDLTTLSSSYVEALALYRNMWSDLSQFFVDFKSPIGNIQKYDPRNIDEAYQYTIEQDKKNKDKINIDIQNYKNKYQSIDDSFRLICEEEIMLMNRNFKMITYEYTGDTVENMVSDLIDKLYEDVENKIQKGTFDKDEKLDLFAETFEETFVDLVRKYSYTEYDSENRKEPKNKWTFFNTDKRDGFFNLMVKDFMDVITDLYNNLNYNSSDEFIQTNQLFMNYSGLPNYAYDPYYNHKNLVHPSYQIHPFLWNFTQNRIYSSIELVNRTIGKIAYDDLIDYAIIENIDKYFGKYGNVINIWKNNTWDHSGYATRYEINSHIHNETKIFGEVVDYDGAFYPPAVEYVKQNPEQCIKAIQTNGEFKPSGKLFNFYDRFYNHLAMSNQEAQYEAERLKTNISSILDVTSDHYKKDVYDIFKYRVDRYNNVYTLYKQYNEEEPNSETVRNTVGQLWIRLNNHPFSVPFYSAINKRNSYSPAGSQEYSYSDLKTIQIIDFEISNDGTMITLIFNNPDPELGYIDTHALTLYLTYQKNESGIYELSFTSIPSGNDNNSSIGNKQSSVYPSNSKIKGDDYYWSYVGMYKTDYNDNNVLYIKRKLDGTREYDGSIFEEIGDKIKLHYITLDVSTNKVVPIFPQAPSTIEIPNKLTSNCIQFTYYKNVQEHQCLDFAVLTENKNIYTNVQLNDADQEGITDRKIFDFDKNSQGAVIDDESTQEMNSHDIFNQTVTISTIDLNNRIYSETNIFNTNTDIGYIPSYPGIETTQELNIKKPINTKYQSIELLGQSKNMNSILESINPNANPYVDADYLYEKLLYGRVYEDFDKNKDVTLLIQKNPAMYQNMPLEGLVDGNNTTTYNEDQRKFTWKYKFPSNIDNSQISDYKILFYSTKTLGRNPYVIIDIKDLMSSGEIKLTDYHSEEQAHSEVKINYNNEMYYASGTTNGITEQIIEADNHIFNISSISISYINREINIDFHINDPEKNIYIENGELRLVLTNPSNLEMFNFYHYIDHYNIVKHRYYNGILNGECRYSDGWISNFKTVPNTGDVSILNNEKAGDLDLIEDKSGRILLKEYTDQSIEGTWCFDSNKTINLGNNWSIQLPIHTGNDTWTKQCILSDKLNRRSLGLYIENNSVELKVSNNGNDIKVYKTNFKIEPNTYYWFKIQCSSGIISLHYNLDHGKYIDIPLIGNTSKINCNYNQVIVFGIGHEYTDFNNPFLGRINISETTISYPSGNYNGWIEKSPYIVYPNGEMVDLSAIDFKNYKSLSQIYALQDYNHLAFKYSEEEFPDVSSFQYFFPAINMAFPYLAGEYYLKSNKIFEEGYYDVMKNAFLSDTTFVINPQDAKSILSTGEIDIGIQNIDTADYRVYEDYLSAINDYDNTNVRYCKDDPLFYQYVHFCGTNLSSDTIELTGIEVPSQYCVNQPLDKFTEWLEQNHLSAKMSEIPTDSTNLIIDKNVFDPNKSDIKTNFDKLEKFLKLYFTYQKDESGITLMVNQSNYIQTPFVKFGDNGEILPDTIPGTYATIKNGESQNIDIIVQFKYYRDNLLCGYNNIKLATYQIINISDDKPKFLLKRLNQVKNGDGKIIEDKYIEIVGDTYTGSITQTSFEYNISLYSNLTINKPITARVIYPGKYFEYSGTDPNVIKKANGWLEVKFEDNHRILRLKFDNTAAISERFGKVNTVIINNVNNSNGENVDVNVSQGKIIINE